MSSVWRTLGILAAAVMVPAFVFGILQKAEIIKPSIPKMKTDTEQAEERCAALLIHTYGFYGIKSWPGEHDRWRDHNGVFNSLWTVVGKNAFGRDVVNNLQCEESKDAKGQWTLPFIWNATAMGGLDPGTMDKQSRTRRRARH